MDINNLQFVVCCVLLVNFSVCVQGYVSFNKIVTENNETPVFAKYTLIKPKIYNAREKREISTTRERDGSHINDLKIALEINGKEHLLNLKLNRELIPKGYFHRYQHKGKSVVKKPTVHDIELCQYQGSLQGVEHSWAALSTCDNKLSGVIFDGTELHYIESTRSDTRMNDLKSFNDHYLYKNSDLIENKKCGFEGSNIPSVNTSSPEAMETNKLRKIHRYKRSEQSANHTDNRVRGPYNANQRSRYVELVLVVDQLEYKKQESNLRTVINRCKNIVNIINALYAPLNIFIALVGVVVWTEVDEIKISENGDTTLTNFLHYRREHLVKEHPNDNAQLITGIKFNGGIVGKALKGPICTYEFSGGVSVDHSSTVGLLATTIAHQMGHNFGMEHDTSDCNCPDERCIMSSSISSVSPKHWSSCSLEYLANAFEHGMDYCLRNKPEHLYDGPVCGNGFVEPGEECDCGFVDNCINPCCNATTCMLHSNASCATGECCNLVTCRPKIAGTLCRSTDHECDLPEYCTGQSEYCPNDVYKMDTDPCDEGKAFCYQGSCRTRSDQCKILWGPSGFSRDECYKLNDKGSRHGNCGYNRMNSSYIKCKNEDIFCGRLHCSHSNDKLEFGLESVAIISHTFINSNGSIKDCRNAIVDLGINDIDPGLTPNGAKCGEGKMCINQKCMAVENLRKSEIVSCPNDCNGNGFCNSQGHCHCKDNFAPPNCDGPGVGGSLDSGPRVQARDPNATAHVDSPEGNTAVVSPLPLFATGDGSKKPVVEEQQVLTAKRDLQVVFRSNRTEGTVRIDEAESLAQHIVEEILEALENSHDNFSGPDLHFRNNELVQPGWFLVTADDEASKDWLLTKYKPYVGQGVSFSAIKANDAPWPEKIGFWLRTQEVDVSKITNVLRLQNRQLNVGSWKFLGKEKGSEGWYLTFLVENSVVKNMESARWTLFYKLMTLPVNRVGSASIVASPTLQNKTVDKIVKK